MKTLWIGRSKNEMDILIEDDSVSGRHAELIITRDDRYYVSDCASSNGTFVRRDNQWIAVTQDYVSGEEPLRFGSFQTTVFQLLNRV